MTFTVNEIEELAAKAVSDLTKDKIIEDRPFVKVKHDGYLADGRYMSNLLDDDYYYKHYGEKGFRR